MKFCIFFYYIIELISKENIAVANFYESNNFNYKCTVCLRVYLQGRNARILHNNSTIIVLYLLVLLVQSEQEKNIRAII